MKNQRRAKITGLKCVLHRYVSGVEPSHKADLTRRRPIAVSRSTISRQSSFDVASGFSQRTGFLAARQARTNGLCVGSGDAIRTASTRSLLISDSGSRTTAAPCASPTANARRWSASVTATSFPPRTAVDKIRAWSVPMMPAPISPILASSTPTIGASIATTRRRHVDRGWHSSDRYARPIGRTGCRSPRPIRKHDLRSSRRRLRHSKHPVQVGRPSHLHVVVEYSLLRAVYRLATPGGSRL